MSSLFLQAENSVERTVITDCRFTSPIKIAKPFYRNDSTEIMMMTASAGMLEGDFYDIEISVKEKSSLIFTGQSYTKLFKSAKKGSGQRVSITVEEDGTLMYLPRPVIPFADSIYNAETEIHLSGSSRFVMCDIISCGRAAMNERFLFNSYRSRTSVYVDGKLVLLDNVRLVPEETKLMGTGFFEDHTHMGIIYLYGYDVPSLPEKEKAEYAVTNAHKGICIRAAADSAEDIFELADKLKNN